MLQYMKEYKGSLTINGITYNNVKSAENALKDYRGNIIVTITNKTHYKQNNEVSAPSQRDKNTTSSSSETVYKIKVRRYMTRPSTPDFDFHKKWNNDTPMPMRIMVGKKLKETKGMVQMELWGAITEEQTSHCMKCGKVLSNPVSRYFGIGPECGGHNYVNPFETEEELNQAVAEMKQKLAETRWTGWVIKSAIEEIKEVEYDS